jgi:hypothetical protein
MSDVAKPRQTARILRPSALAALARWFTGALLVSCALACSKPSSESLGGESNWLRTCEVQSDCGEGGCLCGVCTGVCSNDSDCERRGGGLCTSGEHAALARACGEVRSDSLCLASCSTTECAPGTSCIEEACGPSGGPSEAGSGPEQLNTLENMSVVDASLGASLDASSDGSPPETGSVGPRFDAAAGEVCGFEYLGQQVTCSPEPAHEWFSGAARLVDCMNECARRSDCSAVADRFWRGIQTCELVLSSCSEPDRYPEDLSNYSRVYRATCDAAPSDTVKTISQWGEELLDLGHRASPQSECYFDASISLICEGVGEAEFEASVSSTLDVCLQECDARADCAAVFEFILNDGSLECVVYTGPCNERRGSPDGPNQFLKVCPT